MILSVVMILSMMPAISWATVTEPDETEWIQGIIAQLEMEGYARSVKTKIGSTDVYMYIYSKSIWDEDAQNFEQDSVFIFQPGNGAVNSEIPGYENELESRPWAKANPSAVYIADGVTGIGSHAFDTISTLNKLEIEDPASLTYVGDHAFQNCNKRTGPIDLSGVTNMGEAAFYGCSRLQKVTLGEGLQTIPDNAFNACGLTQIQIPKSVTSIGNSAFANNGFREQPNGTLTLHEGLETIGSNAFYIQPNSTEAISGFQTLVIPCTVTDIGDGAFSGHRRLNSVTVQDENNGGSGRSQLTTVGQAAFGKDIYTAYSETRTIQDAVNPNITYKLVINQATPTIDVSAYSGEWNAAYTGKPLEDYQKAVLLGVGNGAVAPTGELVYTFYTDETCKNPVTENDGIPSEAGKYYLKVTYPGDSNYKQTEVDLIPVTIDPANLAVQVEGYNGTYDGTEHSAAVITSVTGAQGAVSEYIVSYIVTDENVQSDENSNIWKRSLSVKDVADSGKYYWYKVTATNHTTAIGSFQVQITPAALTVQQVPASFAKTAERR